MRRTLFLCVVLLGTSVAQAGPKTLAMLEEQLHQGKLADAQAAMEAELKQNPRDAQARFGLGTVQFLRAVEKLSQAFYRHGLLQQYRRLTGIEFPIPTNPKPEKIGYQQAREIVQNFTFGLGKAEATLAEIGEEQVQLQLHFGLIRMDLNGDGTAHEDETLWKIYARTNRGVQVNDDVARNFVIGFDTGDVYWLRGYCHLLMSFGEMALAHDFQQLFERAGHVLFPNVESPYPFLQDYNDDPNNFFRFNRFVDFIAYVHLINFPVTEPKRMTAALKHLEDMTELSSKSWDLIEKETDDEHEWLPNPNQIAVIPNVRITSEMITTWRHFLSEFKLILEGKKLIPFWRGDSRGVNLNLVFKDPKPFDLVMWIQGTGAAPYLQQGELTDKAVWERIPRVFGGEFVGFALWFN